MSQVELNEFGVPKYENEGWLREQYCLKEKSISEIASDQGVSYGTIRNRMVEFGIPRRSNKESKLVNSAEEYRSEEWLREKYIEEELTLSQIADLAGCAVETIFRWLREFDIPIRKRGQSGREHYAWNEHVTYYTKPRGYETWAHWWNGECRYIDVHRLCAVDWYGFDSVKGKDAHHRIPLPWLTVESNVIPIPKQEHLILTQEYSENGIPDGVVEDVESGLGC